MIAKEIADYLESQSIGTVGTDIFIDAMPDSPNDMVVVYNTGGFEPDIDVAIEHPTFQITTRSESSATAYAKAEAIKALLHLKYNVTLEVDGIYYYFILMMNGINNLGRDEKNRIEYSINFRCKVR
jgi:hypothetical protein